MSSVRRAGRSRDGESTRACAREENDMSATYTFDIVSTVDGFASYDGGDWDGFWGKGGPELLDQRLVQYSEDQGPTRIGSSWSCSARAPRRPSWIR
jgi:hypothetical protein